MNYVLAALVKAMNRNVGVGTCAAASAVVPLISTIVYYEKENSYSANDYYESSEPVGFKPFTDNSEIRGFSI